MNDHETGTAWIKVLIAWLGVFVGGVTLSQVALVSTIAFSVFNIYVGWWNWRREVRMEKLEAKLRHGEPLP